MRKILIVSNLLIIGGAEKLIFELASFAKTNHIEPTVLILDNYNTEYYDQVLKAINVQVVRTRLKNIRHFRAPAKMIRSLIWKLKLKYYANHLYDSVHVIGLYNVDKVLNEIPHEHRYFWNINNAIQFRDELYPVSGSIFCNERDTVVCVNDYQLGEIHQQYGAENIKSMLVSFNLFMNMNDTN